MARPVATGPPVRLSSDGWSFSQEEKLQVQHGGYHWAARVTQA